MTTKVFLARAGISESTLRRWLREGKPLPGLLDAPRSWTGQREWSDLHVSMVLEYKRQRRDSLAGGSSVHA